MSSLFFPETGSRWLIITPAEQANKQYIAVDTRCDSKDDRRGFGSARSVILTSVVGPPTTSVHFAHGLRPVVHEGDIINLRLTANIHTWVLHDPGSLLPRQAESPWGCAQTTAWTSATAFLETVRRCQLASLSFYIFPRLLVLGCLDSVLCRNRLTSARRVSPKAAYERRSEALEKDAIFTQTTSGDQNFPWQEYYRLNPDLQTQGLSSPEQAMGDQSFKFAANCSCMHRPVIAGYPLRD